MDQSSRDDTLVDVGPPEATPAGAVSSQSSRDKRAKRSAGGSSMDGEGRAISTQLTVLQPGQAARGADWHRHARRARLLSWFSLVWMTVEGVVGVVTGIVAGSIALQAFGISSAVEGLASVIVIWRFTGSRTLSEASEHRAQKLVAVSFWLLAPYVVAEAIYKLVTTAEPETSYVGIGLAVSSLVLMPLLGRMKHRLGAELGSQATAGEGTQNILCAYLASAVLVGLLGNTLFGLWWLDSVAAFAVAALAVKEGRESWQGETCDCC
jgi:divalent metal cation (Fe/Co/Zn/Cd) transporter